MHDSTPVTEFAHELMFFCSFTFSSFCPFHRTHWNSMVYQMKLASRSAMDCNLCQQIPRPCRPTSCVHMYFVFILVQPAIPTLLCGLKTMAYHKHTRFVDFYCSECIQCRCRLKERFFCRCYNQVSEARVTTLIAFSMLLSIITGNVRLWKTQGCLILGFGIVHAISCIIVRLALLFVCIKHIYYVFYQTFCAFRKQDFFRASDCTCAVELRLWLSFRISNINMTLTKINPGHLNIWFKLVLIK